MKKTVIRKTAGLLALLLLSGCAGKSAAPPTTPGPTPESVPVMEELSGGSPADRAGPDEENRPSVRAFSRPDGIHADVDFADMTWYLYDMTEFDARADRLAASGDEEEAWELYQWLLTEYARLQTLDELAWIEFYAYGTEADAEACRVTDELLSTAADTMYAAISAALSGPAAREFAGLVGEDVAESFSEYEEMTDRELELLNRETELQLRYNDVISREDLRPAEMNRMAGEIFLELVSIRNELAGICGYDSYAEYAYEAYYGRDYTPEDALALCEAVKPYARRYYENSCYCDAFYVDLGPAVNVGEEELLELLRRYAPAVSSAAAEAQRYMEEHGLHLLRRDIADLGFTVSLELYNAPFLYNSLSGTIYDIQSTIHEFGHYYDAYVNPPENILTDVGSFDIFEIHSTGLEALAYGWYDEIFGGVAEEARIYCLDGLMYNVVSGCMYDEFQQYVYAHPELTVDQVNEAYLGIMASYGLESSRRSDAYEWMYVSHNFESPFYYISYAVSTLASMQIWDLARWDRDAAVKLYNDLVSLGAFKLGYCELLRQLGLTVFTDDLDACLAGAYEALEEMCLRYDGAWKQAA